jgi:nitric oxide dioxygenase
MTPDQISLIRRQLADLKGNEAPFAAAFYARLFLLAPAVRAMFPDDLSEQGAKLMKVLAFAVGALDRPETLAPAVHALGARHVGYGATEAQFAPVAEALLDTLAAALGAEFDAGARTAWTAAITALARLMAAGMAEARGQCAA